MSTILNVNDDQATRHRWTVMLQRAGGYEIREAATGWVFSVPVPATSSSFTARRSSRKDPIPGPRILRPISKRDD
jgi:hypothetical protein